MKLEIVVNIPAAFGSRDNMINLEKVQIKNSPGFIFPTRTSTSPTLAFVEHLLNVF